MNKAAYGRPLFATLAIVSMLLLIVGTVAAKEWQLAGVRLNDHAVHLLDTYGPPDGLVTGPAGDPFADLRAQQAAAMVPGMAGLGMMPGVGMMPEPGMAGPPGIPGMAALLGMGIEGPGVFPGAPPGMPGALPGVPGVPGAAGQVQAAVVPNWALPVYIETRAGEIMWIYQRGPVTLGFLLDLDGYVQAIAVAADRCNYVRTANWQPHKYVKLGDYYSRVLQRYGWADETNTYVASGPGGGAAAPSVSFSGISRTFSRDCVLRYTEGGNNIDFTLHDFRVVRIHIWD